jgi:hypothetical protein
MKHLTNPRVVELKSLGLSNYDVAKIIGCSETTVRRALKEQEFASHLIATSAEDRFLFDIDSPITLVDEDVMVTADWHIPIYNPWLVNGMIEKAVELDIRLLAIGGDFFNFDALSQYDPKQQDAGLARETGEGAAVVRTLLEWFDTIYVIWGNHDARLHKALGYKAKFEHAMRYALGDLDKKELDRVEISNLDHMYVNFTGQQNGSWRLCHPATYSRVPLSTPRTLAAKFGCNIICAHAHHAAIGFASDGVTQVAEIGGLFDQTKTAYLQRTTTFPTWTPGYGWFQEGKFRMTTPYWETA